MCSGLRVVAATVSGATRVTEVNPMAPVRTSRVSAEGGSPWVAGHAGWLVLEPLSGSVLPIVATMFADDENGVAQDSETPEAEPKNDPDVVTV